MSDTPAPAGLLEDQRRRWLAGDAPPVEEYLARHPALAADDAAVLDLIFQEVVLRERRGETLRPEEYAQRFPHLAEVLRLQFAVDGALWSDTPPPAEVAGEAAPTVPEAAAAPAPPAELPQIEGYELLGLLGRGGMGVVYRAWHVPLKRVVALKLLRGAEGAAAPELARLRTEAEAIARLQHPNVVQIYEVGEQRGRPYLALEYVAGGSLADRLDGTPWPAGAAAALVETLARAVQHAHERGIVHRDLKPANVLISLSRGPEGSASDALPSGPRLNDVVPKITDFGLAKFVAGGAAALTGSGQVVGTPSYMAPEQAGGRSRQVGPAADVYALGAVLYELLTGRPPFKGETVHETLFQVLADEPVPPSRLRPQTPRDLETICLHCLRKEPERRYPGAAALADDLRRFQAGEPVRARPVGAAERAWRWARRRPAVAGLLGALAAVIAGALIGLTALWRHADRKRVEAESAHAEALDYFGVAHEAINGYAERVREDPQLREADLRPLRKELLETVIPFYERLTRRKGTSDSIQAEQAQAYVQLAEVTREVDDPAKAVGQTREAIRILEQLVAAHPDEPDYRHRLANQQRNLGYLFFRDPGRPDRGEDDTAKAVATLEELAAQYPDVGAYQQSLALGLNNLAAVYGMTRREDQSVALLHRALTIQEDLVARHPRAADYKEELATSRHNLGTDFFKKGQTDAAENELRAAIGLQEEVTRLRPRDPQAWEKLANYRVSLGDFCLRADRADEGASEFDRAIRALVTVTHDYPSHIPAQERLAACHTWLGRLDGDRGQLPEAEAELQKTADIRLFLARLQPGRLAAQQDLAAALANLGVVCARRKEFDRADAEFQRALAVLEEIPADRRDAEAALLLGQTYYNRAYYRATAGQAEAALPWYARAQELLEDLVKKQAEDGGAHAVLVSLYWRRAEAHMALARFGPALEDWDRALALGERRHRDLFRVSRAVVLAHLKRYAEAVAEAEDLAARTPQLPNVYHAACAIAVSSSAARDDAALEPARRARLAERYAGQAVALLQRLQQKGYFKSAERAKELNTDKDLDPVRARDDFKALLALVGATAKPPAGGPN